MSPQEKERETCLDNDDELMLLDKILAEAEDQEHVDTSKATENQASKENAKPKVPRLREDSTFADAFSVEIDPKLAKAADKEAESRTEEVDSSDDEEIRNFLERKYNEYGCDINKKLKQQNQSAKEDKVEREVNTLINEEENTKKSKKPAELDLHVKNPHNPVRRQALITHSFSKKVEGTETPKISSLLDAKQSCIYVDPVFGLRITKPLISSTLLQERMTGRTPVAFSAIPFHTERGDLTKDWVIAGVLVSKGKVQMTKKSQPYSIWRLSDLKGDIKFISLFLFGGAHKELWKTAEGTCLAVLNPTLFEKRAESKDIACLSIDAAQKVMILGHSKDLGACKALKRNGDVCNATVNLSQCDTCVFHVKQEFSKMSTKRSELQSANAGRGLHELRNKVLGKSEVFYGGQSFTAVPAKKSAKLASQDAQRLGSLSEYAISPFAASVDHASKPKTGVTTVPYAVHKGPVSKIAGNVEASTKQRLKDLERLKALQEEEARFSTPTPSSKAVGSTLKEKDCTTPSSKSPTSSISSLPSPAISEKFKNREFSFTAQSPTLSRDNFSIEVNIGDRRSLLAKQRALEVLKKKPIRKVDPNSTRGSSDGKRRAIDDLNEKFMSHDAKKQKLDEERREQDRKSRLQRIMDASSSHKNLIDIRDREEQEKYFSKLEKKEALEEKMLNTYKMPCKAVICKVCKYTAFSAAERCKTERHTLKVVDAEKRFFQCKDCGNRTVSVFKLPKTCCSKCQSSRWERCAMIRERKVGDGPASLSIRGDEETFVGTISGNANLNLIVPDE